MGRKSRFLREFFKNRGMVGAVSPSTRFLAEKMLENIDFSKAKLIVELGPGTGVFTDLILDRMSEDARLVVFELNDKFYNALKKRIDDPRAQIVHDSAEYISKYLTDQEQNKCDAVVSALPLMMFPDELRSAVVDASYSAMHKKGKFIQFQYSLQSKKYLQAIFKTVDVTFTIKNFPPAFVYTCGK